MTLRIILILSVWGCVSSLNAQSLIGVTLDPDVLFLFHILEFDLSECSKSDTLVSYSRFGGRGDMACGPDSNFYFVHRDTEPILVRVDRNSGTAEDIVAFPFPSGGNVTAMAFRPNGDLILGGSTPNRLAVYNIYTQEFTEEYANFTSIAGQLTALGYYRGRLFGTDATNGLFEIFLEEDRIEMIVDYPNGMNIFNGMQIYEEECGKPIFALSHSPEYSVTYYYLDEDRFDLQCMYPTLPPSGGGKIFVGLTKYNEAGGFLPCRDTIDLDGDDVTATGFDYSGVLDCGAQRAPIAHSSATVYGSNPMDSIRIILENPQDGIDEYLTAPDLNPLTVTGSGSEEMLAEGPAIFQNYETWLPLVEYVNTSVNPTVGERRISVIGYYNFGERTDTAVAHINVFGGGGVQAGEDRFLEFCPADRTVDFNNYLINADSGGVWFSDPMVELDPRNSGDYLYIVTDSCGADTARINVLIWPGPNVRLEGPDQLCAGEEGMLFLDGEVTQIDSLVWNTGSSDTSILVDSTGWYGLELFYGEDCRWSDSIYVEVNDELLEADSTSLCIGDTIVWRGQMITGGGSYEEMVSGGTGCDTLFTLDVDELSSVEITEDLVLCEGESRIRYGIAIDTVGEYRFTLHSTAACDTQVVIRVESREGIAIELEETVCLDETFEFRGEEYGVGGPYEILSEVEDGCDTIWQLWIGEEQYASLEILAPDRLCAPRAEIEITGTPTLELSNSRWNTGAAGIRTTIEEPGLYSWEGESINGCVYRVEKEVGECSRCEVAIPNVFSPNGDDINDVFTISSSCTLIDFRAQIFDRWGKQVVESRQPDAIWNGRDYLPGVYVYRISYKEETEQGRIENIEHGTVTLLR